MAAVGNLRIPAMIIVIAVIGQTYQSPIVEGGGNSESEDNAIGKYYQLRTKNFYQWILEFV